jgi:hypothetical protein
MAGLIRAGAGTSGLRDRFKRREVAGLERRYGPPLAFALPAYSQCSINSHLSMAEQHTGPEQSTGDNT